jgi:hypothetical protein
MCAFDVLLKKMNKNFFRFLNCVFLATCPEFFRILLAAAAAALKPFCQEQK